MVVEIREFVILRSLAFMIDNLRGHLFCLSLWFCMLELVLSAENPCLKKRGLLLTGSYIMIEVVANLLLSMTTSCLWDKLLLNDGLIHIFITGEES